MASHRDTLRTAPSFTDKLLRASDRIINPWSFSVFIVCSTFLVVALTAACVIGPRYGYPADTILDAAWKVVNGIGAIAIAFYLRGQRQQLSRVEVGVNTPSE